MFSVIDLKEIERKAFRATYQDGLMDIFMGVIVVGMSMYVYHPKSGYSANNWIWFILTFIIAQVIFWAGKKFITLPRMGQVRFGPMRQKKNKTLAIILVIVILIQVIVVGITVLGWYKPGIGVKLFGDVLYEHLAVAALGSLFVGPALLIIAYLTDFLRGYYISILMALAVFLMIYTNQPVLSMIIGGLILIPGLALLIRFIRKYPVPHRDEANG